MLNSIQYTGELVPVELGHRPLEGITDLWMRRNPATEQGNDGNDIQTAEEAYMEIPAEETPEQVSIEENFDEWFEKASAWGKTTGSAEESEILRRLEAAEAKNAELAASNDLLTECILEMSAILYA